MEIRDALAYSGQGAVLPSNPTVTYLFLAVFFTAAAGLLAWQNWARRLFVFVLVAGIILRAFRGVSVVPPFSAFLGSIFGVLTGVIVALIYTPPLASMFERRSESPESEEREPPRQSAAPDQDARRESPAEDGRDMTDIEQIWRAKADDEVAEAALTLSEYTDSAARVIQAEMRRRGLPEPERAAVPIRDNDPRCVYVANGLDEANQIVAFLEAAGITSALRGETTTKTHGITVDGLGRLEVLVRESDEERARAALASADTGELQLGEDENVES